MKPTLFLSHSARDAEALAKLKELLRSLTGGAIEIFVSSDGQSIPFGKNWIREVEEALLRAKLMYVFLSPASVQSKWVLFESGYAYAREIRVVPVGIFGVDLSTVGPPLSLLQGFNLASPAAMNNLISIVNEAFEFSFPEGWGEKEYNHTFLRHNVRAHSLFGEHTTFIKEVVFPLQCVHAPESGMVSEFLQERGIEFFIDNNQLYTSGLSFPLHKGHIDIQVDPLLSAITFPLLKALVPFLMGSEFAGNFFFNVFFSPHVLAVQELHRLSARIFGSELKLAENGSIQLADLQLKLRQMSAVTGYSETPTSPMSALRHAAIVHTKPAGVEVSCQYKGMELDQAPIASAFEVLFRVEALYFGTSES